MVKLHCFFDKIYRFLCRIFLGGEETITPPGRLYLIWIALSLAWIYPATLSLWEDEIWMLVVSVDQPWKIVLGLESYYSGNHVLYSLLAKVLIKATAHHGQEFVYRLPALFAAWLCLPLTFAVFARWGGRLTGELGSLLCCFLPTFSYHASNARGYSLWYLFALMAFSAAPGMNASVRWLRLSATYLLLGLSHSLGFITVATFSLVGCFTGKNKPSFGRFIKNAAATIPFFIYWMMPLRSLLSYEKSITRPESWGMDDKLRFIPAIIEEYFGTPWFPGFGFLWVIIMVIGLIAVLRRSTANGIAFAFLSCSIGMAIILTGNPFGFDRIFMGCLSMWLLLTCTGLSSLREIFIRIIPVRLASTGTIAFIIFVALLMLPWTPKLFNCITLPKQDYRGLYREFSRIFPHEKTLLSPTDYYFTGLSYYARQFKMDFVVLKSPKEASDSLSNSPGRVRGLAVPAMIDVPPDMQEWLHEHTTLYREWKGLNLPTQLYLTDTPLPSR